MRNEHEVVVRNLVCPQWSRIDPERHPSGREKSHQVYRGKEKELGEIDEDVTRVRKESAKLVGEPAPARTDFNHDAALAHAKLSENLAFFQRDQSLIELERVNVVETCVNVKSEAAQIRRLGNSQLIAAE